MKLLLSCPLPTACSARPQLGPFIFVIHKMTEDVPQGGAMSSALFNMGQSIAIRPAAAALLQVHILLLADDTHVVGPPEAEGPLRSW